MNLEIVRSNILSSPLAGSCEARYPSADWNLKSWSLRLINELCLRKLILGSRLFEYSLWIRSLILRLASNSYSYHDDTNFKLLLFTILQTRGVDPNVRVLLPEVGPFGFDLFIAAAAGYRHFVAYDKDEATVVSCARIYRHLDLTVHTSTSADFDFNSYKTKDTLIIFPDWPHDDLDARLSSHDNIVRYSWREPMQNFHQVKKRLGVKSLREAEFFLKLESVPLASFGGTEVVANHVPM